MGVAAEALPLIRGRFFKVVPGIIDIILSVAGRELRSAFVPFRICPLHPRAASSLEKPSNGIKGGTQSVFA